MDYRSLSFASAISIAAFASAILISFASAISISFASAKVQSLLRLLF
jgi:hypothetical protein